MKFQTSPNTETLSIEGVECECKDEVIGGVKMRVANVPDTLAPATVKHLVEWHGLTPIVEDEPQLVEKTEKAEKGK